jgi:hypothetical protein
MLISILLHHIGWLMSYQENSRTSEGDEASTSACVDTSERTPNATSHQKEKPDLEAKSPKQQNVPDHCDDENYLADGVYKEIFNVSVEESDDDGHHVEIPRFVCITDRFVVEKDNSGKEIGRLDRTCLRNASVHRGESPGSECNASSSEGRSGRYLHYCTRAHTHTHTLLGINSVYVLYLTDLLCSWSLTMQEEIVVGDITF